MTTPLVVTNNTPVSHLLRIGQLPLLELLFGRVLVPAQVVDELDRGQHVLGAWREAPGADALVVAAPLDGPFLRQLLVQQSCPTSQCCRRSGQRREARCPDRRQIGRTYLPTSLVEALVQLGHDAASVRRVPLVTRLSWR
ncbi:hypothetical protein [Sorangium sp. So ce131]|uniref:hypothetical protein n=1 Tax=Sorangium sp. So ce131 TaxID=3133282 RepID=UPI003F6028CA